MTKGNSVVYLSIDDFEIIVNQLREAKEEFSEDMPPFETRFSDRLEKYNKPNSKRLFRN